MEWPGSLTDECRKCVCLLVPLMLTLPCKWVDSKEMTVLFQDMGHLFHQTL